MSAIMCPGVLSGCAFPGQFRKVYKGNFSTPPHYAKCYELLVIKVFGVAVHACVLCVDRNGLEQTGEVKTFNTVQASVRKDCASLGKKVWTHRFHTYGIAPCIGRLRSPRSYGHLCGIELYSFKVKVLPL